MKTVAAIVAVAIANLVTGVLAECADSDAACHSLESMRLTNEVRARHGKSGQLRPGPQSMLDNAISHSQFMAETGNFEHQDLGAATSKVQCNVAISYVPYMQSGSGMKVATTCPTLFSVLTLFRALVACNVFAMYTKQ